MRAPRICTPAAAEEAETWEPRFTFHGFRYAGISGLEEGHTVDVRGVVLHADMPPIGSFECSNPLLNQLQKNIVWGTEKQLPGSADRLSAARRTARLDR